MAVYPDGNPGASPIDSTNDIGMLRLMVQDTISTPYDPDEPGFVNYTYFSDAELGAIFDAAGGHTMLAVGYAYQGMAASLILQAKNITTDDLRIQTEARAKEFRLLAQSVIANANATLAAFDYWALAGGQPACECAEYGYCASHGIAYGVV